MNSYNNMDSSELSSDYVMLKTGFVRMLQNFLEFLNNYVFREKIINNIEIIA